MACDGAMQLVCLQECRICLQACKNTKCNGCNRSATRLILSFSVIRPRPDLGWPNLALSLLSIYASSRATIVTVIPPLHQNTIRFWTICSQRALSLNMHVRLQGSMRLVSRGKPHLPQASIWVHQILAGISSLDSSLHSLLETYDNIDLSSVI